MNQGYTQSVKRNAGPRRRGIAMVLVLIAIVIGTVLSITFMSTHAATLGIANNLQNQVRARSIAESALAIGIQKIKSDASWRTDFTSGVWASNIAFAGGTFTLKGEDGTYNSSTGAIVGDGNLSNSSSDPVTLTAAATYNGVTYTCHSTVTTPAGGTNMIVYGDDSNATPQYRTWSGAAWSANASATSVNVYPDWVVSKVCPNRNEIAALVGNHSQDVYIQTYNGSAWSAATLLSATLGTTGTKPFDAAYEQLSGKLVMVYRVGGDGYIHYRTWNGTTLSADAWVQPAGAGNPKWLRLVTKPGSNEMMVINLDGSNDISAMVWNGSSWGNSVLLDANAKVSGNECVGGGYLGGKGLIAWSSSGVMNFKYRTWSGTAWSAAANGPNLGLEPQWIKIAYDPNASKMICGTLDSAETIQVTTWDGTNWATPLVVENTGAFSSSRRNFDVGFEYGTGNGMIMWGRAGGTGTTNKRAFYRTWNGTAWSAEFSSATLENKVSVPQLTTGTVNGQMLIALIVASTGSLQSMVWSGSALSTPITFNSNTAGSNDLECFMLAASATNTVGSSTFTSAWVDQP